MIDSRLNLKIHPYEQPKQYNVPAERLQVTFATPLRSLNSPLQPGCYAAGNYRDRLGSITAGKLSKLRRTQSIPTSLFSLIFWDVFA